MGGKYLIAFREENWRRGGPSWRAVVSRRLFTFRRGHRIDQLSLSLPLFLSNREIGEREIFLASSIYSPPRCSFYIHFLLSVPCRGGVGGRGERDQGVGRAAQIRGLPTEIANRPNWISVFRPFRTQLPSDIPSPPA